MQAGVTKWCQARCVHWRPASEATWAVPEPITKKQESQDIPPSSSATSPPSSPSAQSPQNDVGKPQALWIFKSSSLVWRPHFAYSDSHVSFVCGHSCCLWQGNMFHQGSDRMPSPVVTLLEDHVGCTWVMAYQVLEEQGNRHWSTLKVQEAVLRGYDTQKMTSTLKQPLTSLSRHWPTPHNPGYLSPTPEEAIAA